jgi:hypothetical protein
MAVNVPINFFANVDSAAQEFGKLTTVLKGVAAAFAVNKIINGIESITAAASEAEQASFKLSQAMRLAGDYSEQNVRAFEELAEQIQSVTKYDDDLILSQVAVAKQFGATNKEAAKLVVAATDLSAATGIDLQQATQLLGKSLDGTAGRLNELIPGMRGLTQEQLTAGAAVDLVARRFKGAAEGELQTFSGVVSQMRNSASNLLETMGEMIIKNEAVKTAIKGVSTIFQLLKTIFDANKDAIRDFISDGVVFAVNAFGVFVETIRVVDKVIASMIAGFKTLGYSLSSIGRFIVDIAKGDLKKAFSVDQGSLDALGESIGKTNDALVARGKIYDSVSTAVAGIAIKTEDAAEKQKKLTVAVDETKKGFDNLKPSVGRASSEMLGMFAALQKQVEEFSTTQLGAVEKRQAKELNAINTLIKKKLVSEEQGMQLINDLQAKYDKEKRDARLSDIQKEIGDLQKIASRPISFALGFDETEFNKLGLGKNIREAVSAGLGVVGNILQGKQGATKLLSGFAEQMGQAFLGVPGMGALFEMLAQGPEQVRAMVTEFANALPDIIVAVIEAIPVVIETLAENLDEIVIKLVDKLAEKAPDIVWALIKAFNITLPLAIAKAIVGFSVGIVQAVGKWIGGVVDSIGKLVEGAGQFVGRMVDGAGQFVGKILEGAVQFVGKIIEGAGNFINELVSKIPGFGGGGIGDIGGGGQGLIPDSTPIIGWLSKGGTVPDGFPNDSFTAGLTSGEIVVPRDSSRRLMEFLDREESGGGSSSAVERVLASQERNLTVNISVGEADLAKVMLNLNRRGFRTA